jgi:hypothetical protein
MPIVSALRWFSCLICASLAFPCAALAEAEVDLELVLAVDVSRSMDSDELHVQREGYVAAFRHPEILAAIVSGPLGRIAVTYVEWAGPDKQVTVLPWILVDSREAAHALASRLSASAFGRHTGTSISGGLLFASGTFVNNGFKSIRQVIDISGDGPNNRGLPVEPVRAAVTSSGITINGLPLMIKAPFGPYSIENLDVYYEDCVIGGPGTFLIPVHDMSQLALAIRRKLVLEIAGLPPALTTVSDSDSASRVDCLIGEKLIERWLEK